MVNPGPTGHRIRKGPVANREEFPYCGFMSRQRGTVKWFSREKGWGFIRLEGGDEIFVHHSDIEGEGFVNLQDDEPVEFSIEEMDKGPRARNVRSLSGGGGGAAATEAVDGGGTEREPAAAAASHATRAERSADRGRDERRARRSDDGSDDRGLKPLAEQLLERLGRRFPGLRG